MKKLLPILLAVIGIGGGVAAGFVLRPGPEAETAEAATGEGAGAAVECIPADGAADLAGKPAPAEEATDKAYVKLNNQFVVPVIEGQRVAAMVVMSLSVEVPQGEAETVYGREPKLRDAFLQVLFDHANVGGFSGAFTKAGKLDVLRQALREASYHAVGDLVSDVLITEIARQDV
jgi:hypothetical protein